MTTNVSLSTPCVTPLSFPVIDAFFISKKTKINNKIKMLNIKCYVLVSLHRYHITTY